MKGVRYRAGGERGYCFPVSLLRTEHGPKHFHQGEMPLARRHVQGVNASGAVWGRVFMDTSRILPGSPIRPRPLRNLFGLDRDELSNLFLRSVERLLCLEEKKKCNLSCDLINNIRKLYIYKTCFSKTPD